MLGTKGMNEMRFQLEKQCNCTVRGNMIIHICIDTASLQATLILALLNFKYLVLHLNNILLTWCAYNTVIDHSAKT